MNYTRNGKTAARLLILSVILLCCLSPFSSNEYSGLDGSYSVTTRIFNTDGLASSPAITLMRLRLSDVGEVRLRNQGLQRHNSNRLLTEPFLPLLSFLSYAFYLTCIHRQLNALFFNSKTIVTYIHDKDGKK